jgi:hypothetical protein
MTKEQQIIEKQKELILHQKKLIYQLDKQPNAIGLEWRERVEGLEIEIKETQSELSALESSQESVKSADEILNLMCLEMPYRLPDEIKPYVLEAIGIGCSQSIPVKEETPTANIELFAQILGKHCLDNKVYLSSNDRHTVYDAFKDYISQDPVKESQPKEPSVSDEDIKKPQNNITIMI